MRAEVAVITRTKDRNALLVRALESVLAQGWTDLVHVIVNDGGDRDALDKLLDGYQERYAGRLVVVHHDSSRGMEAASNAGINAVESRYVTIHDDDDSWEPTFLERCIRELDDCEYDSVKGVVSLTTQVFEKMEGDRVTETWRREFDPDLWTVSLPMIMEINRFMPISFLFERAVFDEIGMFDESLPVIGDWEFNVRFLLKYDVIVVREYLANYHIRETSDDHQYHNTVTVDNESHQFYRSLIVNRHIRDDIEQGRLSKGELLAQGDHFYRTSKSVWRIVQMLERLKHSGVVRLVRRVFRV